MLRENSKLNMIELPINRGFSDEKKRRTLKEKNTTDTLPNKESSLKFTRFRCSSSPIPTSSNQSGDSPLT